MQIEFKEVESETKTVFYCPYCESEHMDDEFWAEECRNKCYKDLLKSARKE